MRCTAPFLMPPHRPDPPPWPAAPAAATRPAAAPPAAGWRLLLDRTEGRLLVFGLALTLAIAVAVGVGLMVAPKATLVYAAVVGLNVVVGRGAGMSFGIASGMAPLEVIVCNLVVETAQVLVVYPLFVLGWQQLIDTRRIAPQLARLRAAAESGHGGVRRFGIAGLFVFVLMPFWMTGPVVGAIIGFLLGLRTAVNLGVVLSATALAIVAYARLFEHIDAWATVLHPYAVFAVFVALAALAWLVRKWLARPSSRAGDAARDAGAGND
jgi:uncharacterized membrane protein